MTNSLKSTADVLKTTKTVAREYFETCSKCGEQVRTRIMDITIPGTDKPLTLVSDCACSRLRRSEQEREERRQMRIGLCKKSSRLKGKELQMTFENLQELPGLQSAVKAARSFAEEIAAKNPARGLILSGEFGCGKTHIACAILNLLLSKGMEVQFWPCFEILDAVKASFEHPEAPNPIDTICRTPVLVIDDLGNERIAEDKRGDWAREQIFRIAYNRDINNLPTVITTNLCPNEFKARLGGATTSRFLSACRWIEIKSADYRLKPGPPHPSAARRDVGRET